MRNLSKKNKYFPYGRYGNSFVLLPERLTRNAFCPFGTQFNELLQSSIGLQSSSVPDT